MRGVPVPPLHVAPGVRPSHHSDANRGSRHWTAPVECGSGERADSWGMVAPSPAAQEKLCNVLAAKGPFRYLRAAFALTDNISDVLMCDSNVRMCGPAE